MNNTPTEETELELDRHVVWAVAFSILSCATILANIFTIVVFMKARIRRVRKRTHYLLVSLAFADIMVGSLSCPLFIRDLLHVNEHRESKVHLAVHESIDIISGFASILTLSSIAVERLFAVRWPLQHRAASTSVYILLIAMPWLVAMTMSLLYLLGYIHVVLPPYTFSFAAVACLSLALIIISVAYALVWKKVKGRQWRPKSQGLNQERKLAKTLMTITCASLVTWLPFEFLLIVFHFCEVCRAPFHFKLTFMYQGFKLMQFSNSFINTVFYSFRIPEFREVLRHLLKRYRCRKERALPVDHAKSVHLTSVKRFLGSPRLSSQRTRGSFVPFETVLKSVVLNSPLLSRAQRTSLEPHSVQNAP